MNMTDIFISSLSAKNSSEELEKRFIEAKMKEAEPRLLMAGYIAVIREILVKQGFIENENQFEKMVAQTMETVREEAKKVMVEEFQKLKDEA